MPEQLALVEAVGPARPRPSDVDGYVPEYVQVQPGKWAVCVYALIPKNGFSHLHFPHYWGAPAEAPRWRVDRHGESAPDGTFLFASREEAEQVVAEAFPGAGDMSRHMFYVEIPSDDRRPTAAGRRAPRRAKGGHSRG